MNAQTDRRHERRALSADELTWLLSVTRAEPERFGLNGTERAMLYRLAVESGLRASELASLTRASFRLDGDEPTVTVAAAYTKRRREDTLPLLADTAAELRLFLSHKLSTARAFPMPTKEHVAEMLRADLHAARTAWIAEVDSPQVRAERERTAFLTYRDEAGRVIDFHALRHTFITNLARGGVHPKDAQALARHSTITLTMDRYSHVTCREMRKALGALRVLRDAAGKPLRATGTENQTG